MNDAATTAPEPSPVRTLHAPGPHSLSMLTVRGGLLADDESLTYAMSARKGRITPRVFILATLVSAAILVAIVAIPQWLSKQARLEVQRSHVAQIARLAASALDGDLHHRLLDAKNYTPQLYSQALAPLVRFHSANPDIFYVYTMVEQNGSTFFVLDTAASPDLRTEHRLRASGYMERFQLRKEYESDWLQQIAAGKTWVTPTFQQDDYGDFLTAHTPIYDSQKRYSGFVGVDFDLAYYLAQEARFRAIGTWSLAAALLVSLLIGYLIARYHFDLHHRIEDYYFTSIRDGLTGLLNRRGAMDAIGKSLARRSASYATLLVDIDNLKTMNDTHGHAHGDAVIGCVASAIRESIREGDDCARLGGDEFMIFAPDCDQHGAEEIARRILSAVSRPRAELAGASFTVSIGITVQNYAIAGFDRMYREADSALYHAKTSGKHRFALFEPFMAR
jgi:diguanylate cyclase (GGDEF)-like protein